MLRCNVQQLVENKSTHSSELLQTPTLYHYGTAEALMMAQVTTTIKDNRIMAPQRKKLNFSNLKGYRWYQYKTNTDNKSNQENKYDVYRYTHYHYLQWGNIRTPESLCFCPTLHSF